VEFCLTSLCLNWINTLESSAVIYNFWYTADVCSNQTPVLFTHRCNWLLRTLSTCVKLSRVWWQLESIHPEVEGLTPEGIECMRGAEPCVVTAWSSPVHAVTMLSLTGVRLLTHRSLHLPGICRSAQQLIKKMWRPKMGNFYVIKPSYLWIYIDLFFVSFVYCKEYYFDHFLSSTLSAAE
jgi:hypothetical protein